MTRRPQPARAVLAALVAAACALALALETGRPARAATSGFVTSAGGSFRLGGQPFRFGGTNNYYLNYKSPKVRDDVLDDTVTMNLRVMRIWGFEDRGSLDGSVPNIDGDGTKEGVYFQYWDTATGRPAYNDGATGLQRVDATLAAASQRNLRVIFTLTNNWRDFGGMDQYLNWYGLPNHDQFYTDARVRQAFKDWISHVVNRVNTVTGVRYRDDPTIFSWELANEPRCINANKPTSGTCTATTLVTWADEMSRFIKTLDTNHMVSVGDEGFLNRGGGPDGSDWPYNATDGVDNERLTSLPAVDFGTYHSYPDGGWGRPNPPAWGAKWITDHLAAARTIGKPTVLEEFGLRDQANRNTTYDAWTRAVIDGGGAGFMFWMLAGIQDDNSLYPDFDGFTIYSPSATATLLTNAATALAGAPPPTTTGPTTTTPPTTVPVGGCQVTYHLQSQWQDGFVADVTVRNGGTAAITGWSLAWSFAGNQRITNMWNAVPTQTGQAVSAADGGWNRVIAAGGTAAFGFQAAFSGTNSPPTSFKLNNTTCTLT
jgi:mannan endo-1,4-beta-mannosidase